MTLFLGGCTAAVIDWRPFRPQEMVWYQQGLFETEVGADLQDCTSEVVEETDIPLCMREKGYLFIPRQEAELLQVRYLAQKGLDEKQIADHLRWDREKVSRYLAEDYRLKGVDDLGRQPVEVLTDLGRPAVKPLIAELSDRDPLKRRQAVQALGEIGDPDAVQPLVKRLKDEDPLIRRHAAVALGKIKDARAVSPLLAILKEARQPDYVKAAAADALGRIGQAQAVDALVAVLKSSDWSVRSEAAAALGRIGDRRAVGPLIAVLRDPDGSVRENAAVALGELKDRRAIAPLRASLEDEDKNVRQKAERALTRIVGNKPR